MDSTDGRNACFVRVIFPPNCAASLPAPQCFTGPRACPGPRFESRRASAIRSPRPQGQGNFRVPAGRRPRPAQERLSLLKTGTGEPILSLRWALGTGEPALRRALESRPCLVARRPPLVARRAGAGLLLWPSGLLWWLAGCLGCFHNSCLESLAVPESEQSEFMRAGRRRIRRLRAGTRSCGPGPPVYDCRAGALRVIV